MLFDGLLVVDVDHSLDVAFIVFGLHVEFRGFGVEVSFHCCRNVAKLTFIVLFW